MGPDRTTDENLMMLVGKGDTRAFEDLLRRHATSLLTFIHRMIGNHHRSEELFQEVFLAVWRNRSKYEPPRPFRTWLYAIALNQCRAAFRKREAVTQELIGDAVHSDGTILEGMLARETAEQGCQALLQLPTQQRAVVTLRIWQDLSYARIAQIVECSEATVRSHMHHGLLSLRTALQPLCSRLNSNE